MSYLDVCRAIQELPTDSVVAVDVETTGLNPYSGDTIRGVSLAWEARGGIDSYYVSLGHPNSVNVCPAPLVVALNNTQATQVFHHGKFDQKFLYAIGVAWPQHFYDTMIAAWYLDENGPRALKKLGEQLFGTSAADEQVALKALMRGETKVQAYARLRAEGLSVKDAKERSGEESKRSKRGWGDLTANEIAAYARQDAVLTLQLYLYQQRHLTAKQSAALGEHFALEQVVWKMEHIGIAIDLKAREEYETLLRGQLDKIRSQYPGTSLDAPRSVEALLKSWGVVSQEFTATGLVSTAQSALEALVEQEPRVQNILDYRKLKKSLSTYVEPLGVWGRSGRVHASFNTVGTVTGRFSSSNPNLQNIPRGGTDGGVHGLFIAGPGRELWSYDMSQAEVRIAASLSKDPVLLGIFARGEDVYQTLADRMGVARQTAKVALLAAQYGVGPKKLAQILTGEGTPGAKDVSEARGVLRGLAEQTPALYQAIDKLTSMATALGYVPLHVPGRYRHFPTAEECKARGLHDWPKPYTAFNALVQGGQAEILKQWIVRVGPVLPSYGADLVLTVHDSLVVETQVGDRDKIGQMLQEALDACIPEGWARIPIEAKAGI